MSRCNTACLFLLAVFCLAPALARAESSQDIRAAYARLDMACSRHDIPAITAFFAPGFTRSEWNATLTIPQFQADLKDDFGPMATLSAATHIKSLIVHGNTADCIVVRRWDFTLSKPVPEQPPPYFEIEVTDDHWTLLDGQWRITKIGDTPLYETLCLLNARDQGIRRQAIADRKNPALIAQMSQVDAADRIRLKQIIQQYGWLGFDLVGTDGENTAWGIVQHSDNDPAFQKQCLPLIEAAIKRGQEMPSDAAYLTDRILWHEHKPQIYGTQWRVPIADPAHVDERRASVGLSSLTEYQTRLKQLYQPTAKP